MKIIALVLLNCALFGVARAQNKLEATGNVGIGTLSPLKKLEVQTPSNEVASFGSTLGVGEFSGIHFGYLENGNLLYRKSALVFERLDNGARGKIHLLNNGDFNGNSATLTDSRMTINYDGKIGIGTTNPSTTLDVNGHLNVGGVFQNPEGFNNSINVSGLEHAIFRINGGTVRAGIWSDQTVAKPKVRMGTYSNDAFGLFTNGYDNIRLFVSETGAVGIGTLNPLEKLSVNGNIKAKEVKVTVDAAEWPDYVFENNYALTSLPELEAFIQQHKHLPGMPKAAEAEANGVALGEMNRKLLEKLEELTLHLIEKDKLINHLLKRMDTIEKKLN